MGRRLIDDLVAAWPPHEPDEDRGYRPVPLASLRPLDALALGITGGSRRAVVVVEGANGIAALPLVERAGRWQVAVAGDGVAEAVVSVIGRGEPVAPPFRAERLALIPSLAGERSVGVDQTNRSVVVGDAVVVKWYTQPGADGLRAATLLGHLGEVGFAGVARLHGTLAWAPGDGRTHAIALVDELLPDARDGWEWCADAIVEHIGTGHACSPGCPASFARDLGRLVADLHDALARPSRLLAEPVEMATPEDVTAWQRDALADLNAALAVEADDQSELADRATQLQAELRLLAYHGPTPIQPIHGDLHVGQVLNGPAGMRVVDFDGTGVVAGRVDRHPTARDIAHLLVSIELLAEVASGRVEAERSQALGMWAARARTSLMHAYRTTIGGTTTVTSLDDRLIRPFVAHQLCREVLYAAETLPRWRYAPMGALARLYATER